MASNIDIQIIEGRIQHKHDIEVHWNEATGFIPLLGELIIYDKETDYNETIGEIAPLPKGRNVPYTYSRFKYGDGVTNVVNLPFGEDLMTIDSLRVTHGEYNLSNIIETYILNIDYENSLAFDTSEIVTSAGSTTSVLGQAILGQMVLGNSTQATTTTIVLGKSALGQTILA